MMSPTISITQAATCAQEHAKNCGHTKLLVQMHVRRNMHMHKHTRQQLWCWLNTFWSRNEM